MSRHLVRGTGVLAIVMMLFVACSVGDVDFANKACPCGPGHVCDEPRNVCLPSSVVLDGSVSADTGPTPSTACSVNADCKDPVRSLCGPNKECVECLPSSNTCGQGTHCNSALQCVVGCTQESDCEISPTAPHCDLGRHQCVACRTIADCQGADQCSPSGECVEGCDLDAGKLCSGSKKCCNKLCIDTTKDALNCGSCGLECSTANGTPSCTNSVCAWACAAGWGHCGSENTGCETDLRTDVHHCGQCDRECSSTVKNATGIGCAASTCTYEACNMNFDDCDGKSDTGCECACGTKKNERCCPGKVCNDPLTCNAGANKCQ